MVGVCGACMAEKVDPTLLPFFQALWPIISPSWDLFPPPPSPSTHNTAQALEVEKCDRQPLSTPQDDVIPLQNIIRNVLAKPNRDSHGSVL